MKDILKPKFVNMPQKPDDINMESFTPVSFADYESPIRVYMAQRNAAIEGEVYREVLRVGVDVDQKEMIRALEYDRDQFGKGYVAGSRAARRKFTDAIQSVVFYDGHAEWLKDLELELWKSDGIVKCPAICDKWHSEEHVIWMILVGMFGNWGTSIRGGWIEDTKAAAEFVRTLCELDQEEIGSGGKRT